MIGSSLTYVYPRKLKFCRLFSPALGWLLLLAKASPERGKPLTLNSLQIRTNQPCPKGESPPALDNRKQRVDAPPLGGWEVRIGICQIEPIPS